MLETDRPKAPGILLHQSARRHIWAQVTSEIEDYLERVEDAPVSRHVDIEELRGTVAGFDFEQPVEPIELLKRVTEGMRHSNVQVSHPRYFGLFNPAVGAMGIAADALVAAFNPNLAAWSHAPFPVEIEAHLVRYLGTRFGYAPGATEGSFTSGGAESNFTAIAVALTDRFPDYARKGLRALHSDPVIYASAMSHHSIIKGARSAGLGTDAIHVVPVDRHGRMDTTHLSSAIEADRALGRLPFLVVGTFGTTGIGAIDPFDQIATIARREQLWLHADAAWGGLAAFVPSLSEIVRSISAADSITFDAHKGLSVPMGASLYLTRHPGVLGQTFAMHTDYMPRAVDERPDPYTNSFQWSRRFNGMKVFLSLAAAGAGGYEKMLTRQVDLAHQLRAKLESFGWIIENNTPLPLICFTDGLVPPDQRTAEAIRVADATTRTGRAWVSVTDLPDNRKALRACITNYRTQSEHLDKLVDALQRER